MSQSRHSLRRTAARALRVWALAFMLSSIAQISTPQTTAPVRGRVHNAPLVSILAPVQAAVTGGDTVTVIVHLGAHADLATLKVELNKKDASYAFDHAQCSTVPCNLSAVLTIANGMQAGWNSIAVKVRRPSGAAQVRFFSSFDRPYTRFDPRRAEPRLTRSSSEQ